MINPELGFSGYEPNPAGTSDIPGFSSMEGWKNVPIIESNQQLVLLNGLHRKIETRAMYHFLGIPNAPQDIY